MRTLLLTLILFLSGALTAQKTTLAKFSNLSINKMGDIQWTAIYQRGNGFSVEIEKLVNGKWINTGAGLGGIGVNPESKTKIDTISNTSRVKFHKGTNTYRLVMTWPHKAVSEEIKLESEVSNDDGSVWIVDQKILLDEKVQYEIINSSGTTISKGEAQTIDISAMPDGSYFLYTKTWTKKFAK